MQLFFYFYFLTALFGFNTPSSSMPPLLDTFARANEEGT